MATPLNISRTTSQTTNTVYACRNVRCILAWITQSLWIVHRKCAKHQLRLVGVPALRANQQLILPLLNNFCFKLFK